MVFLLFFLFFVLEIFAPGCSATRKSTNFLLCFVSRIFTILTFFQMTLLRILANTMVPSLTRVMRMQRIRMIQIYRWNLPLTVLVGMVRILAVVAIGMVVVEHLKNFTGFPIPNFGFLKKAGRAKK